MTYSFRPYHGPGVDSAPSEKEYQEHFLGVKAAGAWGWPHHLHVPNVMEIWEPKPPGTLWATPGLLQDSSFYNNGTHYMFLYNNGTHYMFLYNNGPIICSCIIMVPIICSCTIMAPIICSCTIMVPIICSCTIMVPITKLHGVKPRNMIFLTTADISDQWWCYKRVLTWIRVWNFV